METEERIIKDSRRLLKAFSKIADAKIREEILGLVQKLVAGRPKPGHRPFELDSRD
jgi:hypothetical protein